MENENTPEEREIEWEETIVTFDVGGCIHKTRVRTLMKYGSIFKDMFSESPQVVDGTVPLFIDRDGSLFAYFLDFWRHDEILVPEDPILRLRLLREARYYGSEEMVEFLNTSFEDSAILSKENKIKLDEMLKGTFRWRLLYRGSRDGFSASSFHTQCDAKGPTLVIVHSSAGKIFGGYSPISWSSETIFKATNESWLFNLNRQSQHAVRDPNSALAHSPKYGPCFGGDFKLKFKLK
eukprot:TRINITY_DN2088_c0_g1_i4.p1 TRINITY_DN2088_c0_g1~~TRINITY_DN2088_c0_g1_i4.p1  ORF type:complete len:236 (+),score=61.45 TRINITY_DN2088_c0_g1_i4:14-721(+)